MADTEKGPSDKCSLCGYDYRTCRHPWDKPFDQWPAYLKADLPTQSRGDD